MEVHLAGYNIDGDVLDEIKSHDDFKQRDDITPETLSASYARISRDPDPINEIRKKARVDVAKSKKSNQTIIFGLGHSSVAEHAVFNLDIIGVSRLLTEYIEKFRLASYTEKSQRYITISKDYIVPKEFDEYAKKDYAELVDLSFDAYNRAFEKIKINLTHQMQPKDKKDEDLIESLAKEDARYLLTLGTKSQLGMTVNARTLESLISYLGSLNLVEANELSEKIFKVIDGIAPSVIKYYKPNYTYQKIDKDITKYLEKFKVFEINKKTKFHSVELLDYKRDFEDRFFAYIMVYYKGMNLKKALYYIKTEFTINDKIEILKLFISNLDFFEGLPRIFELIDFTFLLTCSSSCYAQLKRHRLATNVFMDYDPKLLTTMPKIFNTIGETKLFDKVTEQSENMFNKYKKDYKLATNYFLTNAHRRQVIFKTNLRELVHISRLRMDEHAQWDIRELVAKIKLYVEQQSPIIASLLEGKDAYDKILLRLSKLKK